MQQSTSVSAAAGRRCVQWSPPGVVQWCVRWSAGGAAGLRADWERDDGGAAEGRGGGAVRRSGAVELLQVSAQQGEHEARGSHPTARPTTEVSTREHAHPSSGHAAGVCHRGEGGEGVRVTRRACGRGRSYCL